MSRCFGYYFGLSGKALAGNYTFMAHSFGYDLRQEQVPKTVANTRYKYIAYDMDKKAKACKMY
jgi:hypothetical protein